MAILELPFPQVVADVLATLLPRAYVDWWVTLLHENPTHLYIETTLILVIIYILFKSPKASSKRRHEVTEDVVIERLAAFKPEPLAPEALSEEAKMVLDDMVVLESAPSAARVKVKGGKEAVNFASADFLDYGSSEEVRKATEGALDKYGVGSCGPRGFYGTIDAHVKLEEAIAQFFKKAEAIIYSDGASTVCSAIPAFANRSDLLVVDDGCNDNVFTGVRLSRAKVIKFKHNDMADLERVLKQVQQEDTRLNRKPNSQRRFIVFEGLYRNYGDIAPLPVLHSLKMKYKWRLIADESLSFGVLGKTGKGLTEHFADELTGEDDVIEILIGSLETTLASVGGFCVGSQEVVEHQRLNGAGYCFSASAPPFTCLTAQAALELLAKEPGQKKLKELRERCARFSGMFKDSKYFTILNAPESPVVHLALKTGSAHMDEVKVLRRVANEALQQDGILIIPTYYPESAPAQPQQPPATLSATPPKNTLRLYIHVGHSDADMKRVVEVLNKRVGEALA